VTIIQSRIFERAARRLHKQEKKILDREIRRIAEDPSSGVEKKGDLQGVRIHKFTMNQTQYLLAYRVVGDRLELIMLGPHENYYRDLKTYLKNR
jgi:mRNA interferase RelE/StbE